MKFKVLSVLLFVIHSLGAMDIYLSPDGSNKGTGSMDNPYATIERALKDLKQHAGRESVNIWFNEGSYYLDESISLGKEFSGTKEKPVVFSALPGAKVIVKGSKLLCDLEWAPYKDGIFVTQIPGNIVFDQLFLNGKRKIRARFPNYDYEKPIRGGKGYLPVTGGTNHRFDEWFSFDPETFSQNKWKHPETGFVHAFQSHNWGNMQYRIQSVNHSESKVMLGDGGWQLQRSYGIGGKGDNASWYFIDNIFEELDVAEEWFLDEASNTLYYFPLPGEDLKTASIEVPIVKDLIHIQGRVANPVKNIHFRGLNFTQSTMTFMEKYEPVARGDWAIHRGGAVYFEGVENCSIEDCSFDWLGGNGVFMSGYNRNNAVKNCEFTHLGESAVCFVGSPSAVRFYQTWDDKEMLGKDWLEMRKGMDMQPGPKTKDYPKNCVVENCVMHDFGDVGKQVAGVYISMSHKIRVSHNTIYNCPRAGICINDGTWGGHIIEHCDIWETVRETGEHGPFNAWGRERQWLGATGAGKDFIKEYTKLDALDNVIVRHNRISNFRKSISAGNWTIDLDDGSSYYEIYNNLNLGSTIKLRDGMARKVFNNITISAVPLGWHVWPEESEDEVYQNIFVISGSIPGKKEPTDQFIRPIRMPSSTKWSRNYDRNLYWNVNFQENPHIDKGKTLKKWQEEGYDLNAKIADPLFADPANGDYSVKPGSPALRLGFKNFPMNNFGHTMTRIVPFGGEFEGDIEVELLPDVRAKSKGKVRYTLDGSEPTMDSPVYSKKLKLSSTTLLKAQTFDDKGNPIGFTNTADFVKVDKVVYPSWFSTVLEGAYLGDKTVTEKKVLAIDILGAQMINIADDPDLIDASGGYNTGCFIQSIDKYKGKIWLNAGLEKEWTIQMLNNKKVLNVEDLQRLISNNKSREVKVTAVKNYTSKIFSVKFP